MNELNCYKGRMPQSNELYVYKEVGKEKAKLEARRTYSKSGIPKRWFRGPVPVHGKI